MNSIGPQVDRVPFFILTVIRSVLDVIVIWTRLASSTSV